MENNLKSKPASVHESGKKSKNNGSTIELKSDSTSTTKTETKNNSWQRLVGTVLFKDYDSTPSTKIYAFDIDDTIITPKSGKKFAVNKDDWKIMYPNIKDELKKHISNGFKIVFMSNQSGIGKGKTPEGDWKYKIDKIQEYLDIPFQVFAGIESDYYRKPSFGVWELMVEKYNGGLKVEKATYIGDAAGRPKTSKHGKDFSDSDYKFSINCGIDFQLPEVFFLNEKPETLPKFVFDPRDFKGKTKILKDKSDDKLTSDGVELVIFVGSPGSGKSTFYHNYFKNKGYGHVNQDTLKTEQKCVKVMEDFLSNKNSCVIDNTNPKKEKRAVFIKAAEKYKVPIRCVFFDFPKDLIFHVNNCRDMNPHRDHHSKSVADVIIHTWYKNLERPTESEAGISEVLTVNFVPGPFSNDLDERCFYALSS